MHMSLLLYPVMPWLLAAELGAAYWRGLAGLGRREDAEILPFSVRRPRTGGAGGFTRGELVQLAAYRPGTR
ncbi:MAG: hypothetical protein KIT20_03125 [Alphaproteobacteria bacterium]|nr:hypothetical protein [Alphaproteobacteria bacterium]